MAAAVVGARDDLELLTASFSEAAYLYFKQLRDFPRIVRVHLSCLWLWRGNSSRPGERMSACGGGVRRWNHPWQSPTIGPGLFFPGVWQSRGSLKLLETLES